MRLAIDVHIVEVGRGIKGESGSPDSQILSGQHEQCTSRPKLYSLFSLIPFASRTISSDILSTDSK